ncbi:MAG TPA: winged helix DNA-binding protein [Propionicimonas sp.]|jgi:DNA-binding MarR family transcriptional regulator|nr:winged helix DNA-binding protein [Propionicimonas sp.]
MTTALAVTLHNLVHEMDSLADTMLQQRLGVGVGLFVFLTPLSYGTLDLTHLAKALNLTRAATSKRVPLLERDGWVTTAPDPNHGRRVLVSLTAEGMEMVVQGRAMLSEAFDAVADNAPAVDGDALNVQLQSLLTTLRHVNLGDYGYDDR